MACSLAWNYRASNGAPWNTCTRSGRGCMKRARKNFTSTGGSALSDTPAGVAYYPRLPYLNYKRAYEGLVDKRVAGPWRFVQGIGSNGRHGSAVDGRLRRLTGDRRQPGERPECLYRLAF